MNKLVVAVLSTLATPVALAQFTGNPAGLSPDTPGIEAAKDEERLRETREREQEGAELRARFVARAVHDHAAPHFLEEIVGHFAIPALPHEVPIQHGAMPGVQRLEGAHLAAGVGEHQLRVFVIAHGFDSTRGGRSRAV